MTLQHGSILLGATAIAPSLHGIHDLSQDFDMARFRRELPRTIAESIASDWSIRSYTPQEQELSIELARQIAGTPEKSVTGEF